MCGRYALHAHPDIVALQFGLDSVPEFQPRYNIAPTTDVLIIRMNEASRARWGLRGKFHNLRAETVAAKPAFRDSYRKRRCLLPASGFYEWKQQGGRKQPYYLRPAQEPLFGIAGLWETWNGADSCTLITTEANAAMRGIHHRMPLILAQDEYKKWLAGDEGLLETVPHAAMVAYPVGMAVNRAANDSPAIIEPVQSNR